MNNKELRVKAQDYTEENGINRNTNQIEKAFIDGALMILNQAKNTDLSHDVGVREFECDDVVCTNDGKMWVITEIDGNDLLVTGNGKKDYPLEKSDITHAH